MIVTQRYILGLASKLVYVRSKRHMMWVTSIPAIVIALRSLLDRDGLLLLHLGIHLFHESFFLGGDLGS